MGLYIEYYSVFTESNAPKIKEMCKLSSIVHMSINTAKDDEDNTGDYYVQLQLSSGLAVPCFAGSLQACQEQYELIKTEMSKPSD